MTMKFKKCSILLIEDTYQTKNLKERKQSCKSTILFFILPCGTKFLREFIFCRSAIFCVLQEQSFAIRNDWCFLLGINFCNFQKYPMPSIDNIFVFIEKCNTNIYFKRIPQCTSVFHCIPFLN